MRTRGPIWIAVLVSLCACGGEPPGTDRADAKSVFEGALRAYGRADLPALHGLLTARGRRQFMADLRTFRDSLSLPAQARVGTRELVEARFPGEGEARVDAARSGGPQAALTLLVSLRPVAVPEAPRREERGSGAQVFFYRDAQDVERAVHLIRDKSGWLVDRLGF